MQVAIDINPETFTLAGPRGCVTPKAATVFVTIPEGTQVRGGIPVEETVHIPYAMVQGHPLFGPPEDFAPVGSVTVSQLEAIATVLQLPTVLLAARRRSKQAWVMNARAAIDLPRQLAAKLEGTPLASWAAQMALDITNQTPWTGRAPQ